MDDLVAICVGDCLRCAEVVCIMSSLLKGGAGGSSNDAKENRSASTSDQISRASVRSCIESVTMCDFEDESALRW